MGKCIDEFADSKLGVGSSGNGDVVVVVVGGGGRGRGGGGDGGAEGGELACTRSRGRAS